MLNVQEFFNQIRDKIPEARSENWIADSGMFLFSALFSIPSIALYAITYQLLGYHESALFCWVALGVSVLSLPAYYITRSPSLGGHILTLGAFIVLCIGSLVAGGILGPGVIWFSSAVLLSILVHRGIWMIIWPLLFTLGGLALAYSEPLGLPLTQSLHEPHLTLFSLTAVAGSILLTSSVAIVFKKIQIKLQTLEQDKRDGLEAALQENSRLVRLLSHDINNSLFLITAAKSILTSERARAGQIDTLKYWDRIDRGVAAIESLINHVREHQAVASGKKNLHLQPVNLVLAIQETLEIFKDRFHEKGVGLSFSNQCPPEQSVLADQITLSHVVLSNLLSNALKFSNPGGHVILIAETCNNRVSLRVKDNGVGIPQETLPVLFDMTAKTSRLGTQGEKGTGFGMPLVKAYVQSYGGEISVHSSTNESHGTEFLIHLRAS